jgi:hypothetical protein
MNTENPTPLRVGATGALDGWRARVAGRVVLGMNDKGETYSWNEFNLVDGFGRSATLVFEETEDGTEWKLFKFFEPLRAMTAAEAGTKAVGDTVELDGKPARITVVDQTRVYHIDGVAPSGTEVGDVANYFNAEREGRMLVVSWSGDDIEFYEGQPLAAGAVAAAFEFTLPGPAPTAGLFRRMAAADDDSGNPFANFGGGWLKIAAVALGAAVLVLPNWCTRRTTTVQSAAPTAKQPAAAIRLALGAAGYLQGQRVTVARHALVEIDTLGRRFDRHEYSLETSDGIDLLLINGLNGGPTEWHIFRPVTDDIRLASVDPYAAAARRKGDAVQPVATTLHVAELFQCKPQATDGPGGAVEWPALQYGFTARDSQDWLLARWTETAIRFHRGQQLAETEVRTAMRSPAAGNR